MLTTKVWKLQQPKKTTRNTIARQNPAVQNLVATCELETVLALEYADDCKQQAAQWKKEMEMIKNKLDMSESTLEAVLKEYHTEQLLWKNRVNLLPIK